jgi:superfamily II DNA helicase RecQ
MKQSPGSRASDELSSRLRAWRRERACSDFELPYVVLHDSPLREIADRRPRALAALSRASGIGPVKLERYGTDVIAIATADQA